MNRRDAEHAEFTQRVRGHATSLRCLCARVRLEVRLTLRRPSISVVSEPRAVATGSCAQLSKKLHFASYCVIRSLPLAVLTRLVATLTFNYTRTLCVSAVELFISSLASALQLPREQWGPPGLKL